MRRLVSQVVFLVSPVIMVLLETGYKWGLDW